MTTSDSIQAVGFELQNSPPVYVTALSGRWLLEHTSPSWRREDPSAGFQRIVNEKRARSIALAVLEQRRTFPNAIVLATDSVSFEHTDCHLAIPGDARFLVVDGQHRLWAQTYSAFEASYACVIHAGLTERQMAELFLEINDNQKRVPSSLRWDLVRLVRPDDDQEAIATSEMIFLLATEEQSPLFQRIDLTGERSEIPLNQASVAPEIRRLLSSRSLLRGLSFNQQLDVITQYVLAMKELDGDGWGTKEGIFYKARVFRALLRLLPDIIRHSDGDVLSLGYTFFLTYLCRVDRGTLSTDAIRAAQGSAGIKAIYEQMKSQIL